MKKDNYRKILSEKFKAANQLETGPLTEEDEEYLRILAEARANHAKIKAARQEARKRLAARAAAVLIIAALVSSSYLLGMKSDTKASADNDDEVKVVQQGDNIIIGPGVSEDDENVGVHKVIYTNVESIPQNILSEIQVLDEDMFEFQKAIVSISKEARMVDVYYEDDNKEEVIIHFQNNINKIILVESIEYNREEKYKGSKIYIKDHEHHQSISFLRDNQLVTVSLPKLYAENKKETIFNSLIG